jgi:hypothetical protein
MSQGRPSMPHPDRAPCPGNADLLRPPPSGIFRRSLRLCAELVRVCARNVASRARNGVVGRASDRALRRIGRDASIIGARPFPHPRR